MKSVFKIVTLACGLALVGCTMPALTENAAADFGPPPPANYQDIVKAEIDSVFYENKTAVYQIAAPVKATAARSRFVYRQVSGWAACGTVNRRPTTRGYNGFEGPVSFFVLFKDGKVADKLIAAMPDEKSDASDVAGGIIKTVCHGV